MPTKNCCDLNVLGGYLGIWYLRALVGREEELELLLRRWSAAKSGEGQAVRLWRQLAYVNKFAREIAETLLRGAERRARTTECLCHAARSPQAAGAGPHA